MQDNRNQLLNQALDCQRRGDLATAERLYVQMLSSDPHDGDALHLLGVVRIHQGRNTDALEMIGTALKKFPNDARANSNYAIALHNIKAYEAALSHLQKAIKVAPDFPEAYNNRGLTLHELGRYKEALRNYDKAISLRRDYFDAFFNRGNTLHQMREYEEAALSYQKALALRPAQPAVLNNLGNSLTEVNRFAEALAALDKAIAIKPDYADALNNRGKLLFGSLRYEEALTNYDRALFVNPDHVEALNNRGNVLKELKRHNDAVYDFEKALALQPNHRHAFGGLADAALKVCDWTRTGRISNELEQSVVADRSIVPPLTLLGYSDDPKLQLECAKTTIAFLVPSQPQASWTYHKRHERVRIAYLSADFYRHATAFLMAGLIELHDRQEFEIYGLSYGPDDQSDMRKRLVGAFDHFHEVGAMADGEVARLVRSLEIDIAVDLKGLTRNCRPGMLASRPAPVQVSYLGYPGTMGAPFIDYVMADKIVLPLSQQASWMEKIVHLPHCYQVNDARRVIAPETPTRRDAGLPESGFVFCSFNNNWKITAPVFTVWMRLLAAVPDSVLWLLGDNPAAIQNLRKEASARGVDPNRLVFADMIPLEQHLARHKLADLFLDTIPVNAHTTASDSLWAGLPVLTCQGVGFASRVAASLLNACDLGELATETLEDYEQMAVRLATDNSMLHQLRHKLEANKRHCRLFDTDAFRRNIEAAYRQMWDRFRQGQAPAHFSVQP